MGYYLNGITNQKFRIKAEHINAALGALQAKYPDEIDENENFYETLYRLTETEAVGEHGNIVKEEEPEDITWLSGSDAKASWFEDVFNTLAPFIEGGSFIELAGEDGEKWRLVFTGGEMKSIYPKMIWDSYEASGSETANQPITVKQFINLFDSFDIYAISENTGEFNLPEIIGRYSAANLPDEIGARTIKRISKGEFPTSPYTIHIN